MVARRLEFQHVHGGTGEQIGVARVLHLHLPHHLADDDLDVLVVDVNALLTVNRLDLLDQVVVDRLQTCDAKHVVGAQGTVGEPVAALDHVAVGHLQAHVVGDLILLDLAVVGGDRHRPVGAPGRRVDGDLAGDLRQLADPLGLPCLEQLLNTGKTLGDIVAGNAAGVEGTHGQLRARFADGLGRDDADGLTKIDLLGGGQVHAVALGAHAAAGLAAQHRADTDGMDPVGFEELGVVLHHQMVLGDDHLAGDGIAHVLDGIAAPDPVAEGIHHGALLSDLRHLNALGGAAVLLPDDDILGHVHQTAGQIAGVRSTEGGIGQALPGASGRDEVLQNGQALTEVGLDRDFDGLTGGVGHQATHAGQLTDLAHGSTGAGVRHHIDGVEPAQVLLQGVGNLVGGLFPLGHGQAVAFVVGDIAALVELVDLDHFLLRLGNQSILSMMSESCFLPTAKPTSRSRHFSGSLRST